MAAGERIRIFGDHDDATIAQLERCVSAEEGARGVLCADGHLGYSQPIGGVVAYREHLSPSGVGFDIGCGNKAVRTELHADDVRPDLPRLMDEVIGRIEFGVGRTNDRRVDHPVLDEIKEASFAPQRKLRKLATEQLGTVGAGNHYVNLLEDEDGWIWVGVHFGSRGFGHRTAAGFLALSQGRAFDDHPKDTGMDAPPVLFHEKYELGQGYLAAMLLAARYAYAGRDIVVDEVLDILGAQATDEVHNNHNELWRETHDGEELWVVRKGATPAFPGQRGFVGASMGEPSVILEGVDSPASKSALHSTVHGAGRAMSRTQAAGKLRKHWVNNLRDDDTLYPTREEALAARGARSARSVRVRVGGRIDFRSVKGELREKGIELRGGAADEAPGAYKRLGQVLAYHEGTVRVLHTLTPLGVAMAGPDTYDPYKD
jgi:tRNA-splicing ligase RtcB